MRYPSRPARKRDVVSGSACISAGSAIPDSARRRVCGYATPGKMATSASGYPTNGTSAAVATISAATAAISAVPPGVSRTRAAPSASGTAATAITAAPAPPIARSRPGEVVVQPELACSGARCDAYQRAYDLRQPEVDGGEDQARSPEGPESAPVDARPEQRHEQRDRREPARDAEAQPLPDRDGKVHAGSQSTGAARRARREQPARGPRERRRIP